MTLCPAHLKSLKGDTSEVAIAGGLPNNSMPLQAVHAADAQAQTFRPDGANSFGVRKNPEDVL